MALTEAQMTHEEMSKMPKSWKGPAYLCPDGHQMHPTRFEYMLQQHATCSHKKDMCCLGGCGWLDEDKFMLDKEDKKRTEGRKERETEDESAGK